jgi:hypothetical protein
MNLRGVKQVTKTVAFLGLLLAVGGAATSCGGQVHEAGQFDEKRTPLKPIRSSNPQPTLSEVPTPSSTPIDVCGLVPPAKVQQIFARKTAPKLEPGKQDEEFPIPGSTAPFRCTYKWGAGTAAADLVTVTIIANTGKPDAAAFVKEMLVDKIENVGNVGEAAGINRSGRFGQGVGALASAKKTDDGVTGVTVLAPQNAKVQAYAGVAREFLAKL